VEQPFGQDEQHAKPIYRKLPQRGRQQGR